MFYNVLTLKTRKRKFKLEKPFAPGGYILSKCPGCNPNSAASVPDSAPYHYFMVIYSQDNMI